MTAPRARKRPHSLHDCRSAQEFRERFEAEAGCSIETVIERLVPLDRVAATILAGSIPLGIATGASDLDLLVLIDSREALRPSDRRGDASTLFSGEYGAERAQVVVANVVELVGGIEVDFLFASASGLRALGERVSGANVALSIQEIQLLSRIKTGWMLTRRGRDEDVYGALLRDNSLEVHCTVRYLVTALKALEHARAALSDNHPLAFHLGRTCVEQCFAAYFASQGYAFLGNKWLRFLERHEQASAGARHEELSRMARRGIALLFPALELRTEAAASYLDEVAQLTTTARRLIEADLTFKVALRLSPQIHEPAAISSLPPEER